MLVPLVSVSTLQLLLLVNALSPRDTDSHGSEVAPGAKLLESRDGIWGQVSGFFADQVKTPGSTCDANFGAPPIFCAADLCGGQDPNNKGKCAKQDRPCEFYSAAF